MYAAGSSLLVVVLLVVLLRGSRADGRAPTASKQSAARLETGDKGKAQRSQERELAARADSVRKAAEVKRQAALARIQSLERHAGTLRQTLAQTEAAKSTHATKVKAYAMDHKAAIAAMGIAVGGVATAADRDNKLNDNQKAVLGILGVGAGLYALSHHEECLEVANRMTKAAAIQKDFEARIIRTRKELSSLMTQIASERTTLR